MDALWVKQGNGLIPADPVTADMMAAIGQGQHVRTSEPLKPRNPDFHRRMMAGLSELVANAHPRFADVEEAMDWLKLKSGMIDYIGVIHGMSCIKPKSVSFSAMDQVKFKAVSEQWRELALSEFGIDILAERS